MGVTTVLIVSIAANTALAIYATPSGRERVDRRVEKGIDKFARRYGKYGQWDMSVDLLRRLHALKPTSRPTLRKLANALKETGNDSQADKYLRRAVKIDLKKLEKTEYGESYRRSLVRSYRMLGLTENAETQLENALRIGLERIEKRPNSASAAYSLGRTYSLMDNREKELAQLERAHQIRPTVKKYKKAFLQAKHNR